MEHKPQSNPRHHTPPTIHRRECLKNHAASLGGHALDGCCEFLPSPPVTPTPTDPTALKCAACGCHRNFHRPVSFSAGSSQEQLTSAAAPRTLLALSRGETRPPKRFRTKFSAEQKEKMRALSERVGWRLQKRDEGLVEGWCREIGVGKGVFKVWMHNNKYQIFAREERREGGGEVGAAGVGEGEADGNVMNASSGSS